MENTYAAYCLDEAIIFFGNSLEAALERVSANAKTEKAAEGRRKLELAKWMMTPEEREKERRSGNSGFANPVATK